MMRSLSTWLLRILLPDRFREHVLDELNELHQLRVSSEGQESADRWYRRQVGRFALQALLSGLKRRSAPKGSGAHLVRRDGPGRGESLKQDIKYGLRAIRRGKVLTAVAVMSLGIGIGASTSIYSAIDVFLLRPLPFPESRDLYQVWGTNAERGWTSVYFSAPNYRDIRERSQAMDLAATDGGNYNLSTGDRPERLTGKLVTSNFFDVLGVHPAIGRDFALEEEQPGLGNVAIISDGLWRRRFGADLDIVGTTVLLDGEAYSIVGVMPPDFWYKDLRAEIWTPMVFTGEEHRGSTHLEVLARLEDGLTKEQAADELRLLMQQLEREYPEQNGGLSARLLLLRDNVFNEGLRVGSLIAIVAVAFVLLIACANVANLLLTHAAGRGREVALRGALGAGRARIVRQFLTEAMIVAALGGVLGLALSLLGIRWLLTLVPWWFQGAGDIGINGRVLLFTAGVSLLTGLLFGLAPALESRKLNMVDSLKECGRSGTAVKSVRLRKALVVSEVSLALVLLVSSVLLVQGFARLHLAEVGFAQSDVLSFRLSLPESDYPDSTSVNAFHTELMTGISTIPSVESVGAVTLLPLEGNSGTYYALPGEVIANDSQRKIASFRYTLPGYFAAMDIPVIRGRAFNESDRQGARRVMVINDELAKRHWADESPIGKQLRVGSGSREIVGVVANAKYQGADRTPDAMLYFPALQSVWRTMAWVVEATVPPETIVEAIRSEIQLLDPNLPAYAVQSLEALMDEAQSGPTNMVKIMGVLAAIALVLALGGVYGIMAYTVSQRTQELGIRVALGAQNRDVLSMVVRQGAVLGLIGVLVGIGVALGVTRGLSQFLFGVSPFDPLTFGGTATALLLAGLAATYFPARRATKVDPVVALRTE